MSFTRIRISKEATTRLSLLKGRTQLTPNILSRLAFCLSLSEPSIPDPKAYDENGQEFNRFTLTGEWDLLFISLLKERLLIDGLNPTIDLLPQFKAHLNRGVLLLFSRVKGLPDIYPLISNTGTIADEHNKKNDRSFSV